jgi:hypothetical protein
VFDIGADAALAAGVATLDAGTVAGAALDVGTVAGAALDAGIVAGAALDADGGASCAIASRVTVIAITTQLQCVRIRIAR